MALAHPRHPVICCVCSPTVFVHLRRLLTYGIWPSTAFAHLRHPAVHCRCSPTASGHLLRLLTCGIRPPTAFGNLRHLAIYGVCSPTGIGHLRRLLTYGMWVWGHEYVITSLLANAIFVENQKPGGLPQEAHLPPTLIHGYEPCLCGIRPSSAVHH
jgi:hypothetical protein